MNKKPVMYLQADSRWSHIPYTIDADKDTISTSGCALASTAMILATWVNPKITPADMCKLSLENHMRTANQGTSWTFFKLVADKYKLKFQQTGNMDVVLKALQSGAYVITSFGKGHFTQHGHFVLLWNFNGKEVSVNDCASMTRTNQLWSPTIIKDEAKQFFIFYPPTLPVKKPSPTPVKK